MATLAAPPRWWLPIDLDDVVVPKGLGSAERLTEAALFVRDHLLPDEFYGARMIVVPSASTGRKGDCTARLRLFALLASPHSLRAMKNWAKGAAATLGLPIDSAPIQAGQPIYTGRPIFEGVEDPVPRALYAQVLDGDHDTVALVVDQFALKLAASEAKIDRVIRGCGSQLASASGRHGRRRRAFLRSAYAGNRRRRACGGESRRDRGHRRDAAGLTRRSRPPGAI